MWSTLDDVGKVSVATGDEYRLLLYFLMVYVNDKMRRRRRRLLLLFGLVRETRRWLWGSGGGGDDVWSTLDDVGKVSAAMGDEYLLCSIGGLNCYCITFHGCAVELLFIIGFGVESGR